MATRPEVVERRERSRPNAVLGWLIAALVIAAAVVAIVLVNGANNRANTADEQVTTLQTQLQGAQARANLSTLRANILSNADEQTLQQQYERVRSGLQDAYENASGAAAGVWDNIQPQLDSLQNQIAQDRQKAADTVQNILNGLPEQQ